MNNDYSDIINLPHPTSEKHPRMSTRDRAAQFSPFAALTGYDDAVKETARLTDKKIELSEYEAEILTERTNLLIDIIDEEPEVNITYFIADKSKDGGKYVTEKVCLKKIDVYERTFITSNGITIPMDDVILIEGDIFIEALGSGDFRYE